MSTTSFLSLQSFCRQLLDIVPPSLADVSSDCKRLASAGVLLHDLTTALERFATEHCLRHGGLNFKPEAEGGLSYQCETPALSWSQIYSALTRLQAHQAA